MRFEASFLYDTAQRISLSPRARTENSNDLKKFEDGYEIKQGALGYNHKIVFSVPDGLNLEYGKGVGFPTDYEGAVKKMLRSFLSRSSGVRSLQVNKVNE